MGSFKDGDVLQVAVEPRQKGRGGDVGRCGNSVEIDQQDPTATTLVEIGKVIDTPSDGEPACLDLFAVTTEGEIDLVVDVVLDRAQPRLLGIGIARDSGAFAERQVESIELANDLPGKAAVVAHGGIDRSAARVPEYEEQRGLEVLDAVVDRAGGRLELVADVLDDECPVDRIEIKHKLMQPRIAACQHRHGGVLGLLVRGKMSRIAGGDEEIVAGENIEECR